MHRKKSDHVEPFDKNKTILQIKVLRKFSLGSPNIGSKYSPFSIASFQENIQLINSPD